MNETEIKALAEQLKPIITTAIQQAMPDRIITVSEARKILGVKQLHTVLGYIDAGQLTNHGTGSQRPKLSYNEVASFKMARSRPIPEIL